MKRFLIGAGVVVILLGGYFLLPRAEGGVRKDGLYLFSQEKCGHCHDALAVVNTRIRENYPTLPVFVLDIAQRKNRDLFWAYAKAYELDESKLGTPLIFIGERALVGWSGASEGLLTDAIDAFWKPVNAEPALSDDFEPEACGLAAACADE